jgi:hypothetical protein
VTGLTISVGARHFSLLKKVQTGFWAHPASYAVGTGVRSQEVNGPICGFYHSPPSNAEFKNEWSYTSTPAICLHVVDGDVTFFYLHKAIRR